MLNIFHRTLPVAVCIAVLAGNCSAIEDLKLQIRCPDVLLSWPSAEGEMFIVQYRQTLDTNSSWTTLIADLQADLGTNWTIYTHSNVVQCAEGEFAGGSGEFLSASLAGMADEFQIDAIAVEPLPTWEKEGREPYQWEKEDRPPYPWEWQAISISQPAAALNTDGFNLEEEPLPLNGDSFESPETGFYRVVRLGAHLFGLTNGTVLSGTVQIPVEAGWPEGTLSSVSITVDGSPVFTVDTLRPPFDGPLSFELNTALLLNGEHLVQAEATWLIGDGSSPDSAAWISRFSTAVSVEVYNPISFPEWIPFYGEDYMVFEAQSVDLNAYFEVDMFGTNGAYIVTLAGYAVNGIIEFAWDFTDYYNIRHGDDYFYGNLYTFSSSPAPEDGPEPSPEVNMLPIPPNVRRKDNWPEYGDWVVVNQQAWNGKTGAELLDSMTDGWVGYAHGAGHTVRPVNPNNSGEAFRIRVGASAEGDWAQFKTALTNFNSRNLYYFGHGAPYAIGGYPSASPTVGLTGDQLRELLFQLWTRTLVPLNTNHHDYRFVFIDGCESASGNPGLPSVFGIYASKEQGLEKYVGVRPSAFVGWSESKVIAVGNSIQTYHPNFVGWLLYEWVTNGRELRDAIDRAASYPDTSGVNIGTIRIRGYGKLRFDEFNTR